MTEERSCPCGTNLKPSQGKYCSTACRVTGLHAAKGLAIDVATGKEVPAAEPCGIQPDEYAHLRDMTGRYVPPVIPPVGMIPVPWRDGDALPEPGAVALVREADMDLLVSRVNARDWRRPQADQDAMDSWSRRKP